MFGKIDKLQGNKARMLIAGFSIFMFAANFDAARAQVDSQIGKTKKQSENLDSPSASSEILSTEELRDLQVKLNKRQDLSVDFSQVRISALRPNKPSKSSGKAIFAKPAKFRWEILAPAKETLIFDGSNIYSFKEGDGIATKYKTEGDKAKEIKEIIDFVLDFDALLKRYQLKEAVRTGHKIQMQLTPKGKAPVSGIEIGLDAKNFFVTHIKMIFQNKNSSEFVFTNPALGQVTPTIFSLPKDMKVVDGL